MSQYTMQPFQPRGGVNSTTALAVTASNQTFTLPAVGPDGASMLISNSGTQVVFIAYGSVTASVTTSMPIINNSSLLIQLPPGVTQLSAIAGAVGSTIYATVGDGCII